MASRQAVATVSKDLAPAPDTQLAQHKPKLVERCAARFGVDADKMLDTLKATAFRQRPASDGKPPVVVTNEHMMMLLLIAEEYHLNPFMKMLYAFPQEGGIVPVIGYDGWLHILNTHPMLDYWTDAPAPDGTSSDDWFHEVEIKRKDRSKPTTTRKYLKEYYRNTKPWNEMPRHMIELKATIQGIRKTFGFSGVYDPDEAERIFATAIDVTPRGPSGKPETRAPQARIPASDPAPAADVQCISLDQATTLADKLKEEGVALNLLLARFEIGSLEELPAISFDAAVTAIEEASAG